jgi:hypothetical protein
MKEQQETKTYDGERAMNGIQYVTDARGRRTAVLIDLKKHGDVWEDFQDSLVARLRVEEPRESLESVKKRLLRKGKLRG